MMASSDITKLFFFCDDFTCGEIYVDHLGNFVNVVHENDGHWSSYLDFVADFFDGKVVRLDLEEAFENLTDEELDELDELDFEEKAKAIVEKLQSQILKAIEDCDE